MVVDQYYFNSETLEEVITVGKKQAKVQDHVSDALSEKFKDHSEILAKLFWLKQVLLSGRQSDKPRDIGRSAGATDPTRPLTGIVC